jgi:cytochrome c-type biogenesis protein CcmF
MIGQITVWISFGLSVLLTVLFFIANGKNIRLNRFARIFYYALPFTLLLSSAYLMYNILTHNYQFTYIWSYSNNFLPTHILLTTFFSGQEGSFLLWAVLVAFFALFARKYARKYGYEELVMAFFSLTLVFITFMLILKSPFDYVWNSFPDQGIEVGFMPPDGRGLNPILENFWNMIHPPILFIGYAAMTVPFVFAIAALIKKDYQNWIRISTPWTLFATGILGLGIMLGGFWSYETLGWGGFWAWDPVENASLMPWLIGAALVHSMIVQRKSGSLVKTNFLLAMLTYIFVLFSTFLTRSGILGDMSVHSFGEPGAMAYAVLLGFLLLFLLLSIVLLLIRWKDINEQNPKSELNVSSREFALSLGMIALILSTFVVLIGTTLPITSGWFSANKSSVDISFYDKWNIPIAIIVMILNGISFYMRWKNSEWKEILRKTLVPSIIALVSTIVLVLLQIDRIGLAILAFAAILSIVINVQVLARVIKKTASKTGSMLSHIGIAIMLIGVIFSGTYSQKEAHSLKLDESTKIFGYNVTYVGNKQIEKDLKDREKYEHTLLFEKDGAKTYVKSILYWSDFNNREQVFLEPGIKTGITKDIYISPVSFDNKINLPLVYLDKFIESALPGHPNIKANLTGYDMSGNEKNSKGEILFGAIIDFNISGYKYQDTLYTWLDMASFNADPIWYPIDSTNLEIGFSGLKKGMGEEVAAAAMMLIKEQGNTMPSKVETFTFQVELKPFMYLVWIGSIFLIAGLFIAITKYRRKEVIENQ